MRDQPANNQYLISIGSNIDPETNINLAIQLIAEKVKILSTASIWQTPAVGSQGPDYLNTALLIGSSCTLNELKDQVLYRIEIQLGRIRSADKNADRTIDLDIILQNGSCLDDELWSQAHIAVPASEILPDCRNPQTGELLSNVANALLRNSGFIHRSDLDPI